MTINIPPILLFAIAICAAIPHWKHLFIFTYYKAVYVSPANISSAGPLVLDLDDDGIELNKLSSNKDDGPYFDFDGDDIKTLTGWVGAEDGLLAIDRNNNDKIDNTSELFAATEKNPFKALSRFDMARYFFFKDGVIDKTDAAFSQLRVWRDYNSDGYPHHTELKKLTDLGIASISTKAG